MQRIIKINVNYIIKLLNQKFKQKNQQEYQSKIDKVIKKLDIEYNFRALEKYLENTVLECYTSFQGDDFIENFDVLKFIDEVELYFVYKILIEMNDFFPIDIRINVMDEKTGMYKEYLDGIMSMIQDKHESEKMAYLEEIAEKSGLATRLDIHGNSKSVTNALLGKKSSTTYRVNTSEEISYNFNAMKKNEHRQIICPICDSGAGKDDELLRRSNKSSFFLLKRNSIVYTCRHEKSEFFGKKPVEISLKEYKKELERRGINPIDFMIYNYKIFWKRILNDK